MSGTHSVAPINSIYYLDLNQSTCMMESNPQNLGMRNLENFLMGLISQ